MENEIENTDTRNSGGPGRLLFVPVLLASAYAAVGANMQGIFSLLPIIREEFDLTRAQAGLYSTFYFLSATAVAIFSGRLIDILGTRKGLIFGVTGIAAVMMVVSQTPTYRFLLALAFVCGVVFSVITPSVSRSIMHNAPAHRRAFSMGIAHSGGNSGGMVAAALLPLIATRFGWRPAIFTSALFAMAVAVVIVRYYPAENNLDVPEDGPAAPDAGFLKSFGGLRGILRFLSVCAFGILLGCVMSSVGAHFALFLTEDFQLSPVRAGMGLAALQIGAVAGMSGWGLISDKVLHGNRHRALCCVAASISIVSLLMGVSAGRLPFPYATGLIIAFVTGFICLGTMALFFTTITESVDINHSGMATGMALIFSRSGVIVGPPVFGKIADITGTYRHSWLAVCITAICFAVAFATASRLLVPKERL